MLSSVKMYLSDTLAIGDRPTCHMLPDDGVEVLEFDESVSSILENKSIVAPELSHKVWLKPLK